MYIYFSLILYSSLVFNFLLLSLFHSFIFSFFSSSRFFSYLFFLFEIFCKWYLRRKGITLHFFVCMLSFTWNYNYGTVWKIFSSIKCGGRDLRGKSPCGNFFTHKRITREQGCQFSKISMCGKQDSFWYILNIFRIVLEQIWWKRRPTCIWKCYHTVNADKLVLWQQLMSLLRLQHSCRN